MINLLPPEEKNNLFLGKVLKLSATIGISVLASLFCLYLILQSINFYLLGNLNYQKSALEEYKKLAQSPDFLNFKDIILDANQKISLINSFYKQEVFFAAVLKTLSRIEKPSGLYFTNVYLARSQGSNGIQATISGKSDTRDNLLIFKNNIESEDSIKSPYFSPESWVNQNNVIFHFTFSF